MEVIRGVDLERGETVAEAFVRVAGVADGGETIEILAVALDEFGFTAGGSLTKSDGGSFNVL